MTETCSAWLAAAASINPRARWLIREAFTWNVQTRICVAMRITGRREDRIRLVRVGRRREWIVVAQDRATHRAPDRDGFLVGLDWRQYSYRLAPLGDDDRLTVAIHLIDDPQACCLEFSCSYG